MEISRIFEIIKREYNLSEESLVKQNREKYFTTARVNFSLLANYFGFSLSEIGRVLNRNHSTIWHYIQNKDKFKINPYVNRILEGIEKPNGDYLEEIKLSKREIKYDNLFQKANYRCEVPGCGFGEVLEIHHIKPRKMMGTNDQSNLIVLCPNHHSMADKGILYIKGRIEP